MTLSGTSILKVGLEAKPCVESDKTTFDTPSHTFLSRKLRTAAPVLMTVYTAGSAGALQAASNGLPVQAASNGLPVQHLQRARSGQLLVAAQQVGPAHISSSGSSPKGTVTVLGKVNPSGK